MAIARPDQQLFDALSAPIGDLIAEVGRGVAEAQQAMDAATIEQVRALADEGADASIQLLRQIGYQPTWYQIPEVNAEISVALTLTGSGTQGTPGRRLRLHAAPVDATYTSRYNYELKATSTVRFRIVPVPPSPVVESMRVVPLVVGLTFAAAKERLDKLDIPWRLPDNAISVGEESLVGSQIPAAGELLIGEAAVELGFGF